MTQDIRFETVERKVYPHTFLSTVFVIFDYDTSYSPADVIPLVRRYVKENFNLEIELTEKEYNEGFSIDNNGAGHSYYFAKGRVGVKYMGDNYVSFPETMMPLVYRLLAFLKNVLSVSTITNAQIRKVNVWNAREQDNGLVSEVKLVQEILSPELISLAQPAEDYLGLEDVKDFNGSSDGDTFDIHFGFQRGEALDGGKYVGLVLDESVFRKQVTLNSADSDLTGINDKFFNMFHWSVSSTVLALMSKEV